MTCCVSSSLERVPGAEVIHDGTCSLQTRHGSSIASVLSWHLGGRSASVFSGRLRTRAGPWQHEHRGSWRTNELSV